MKIIFILMFLATTMVAGAQLYAGAGYGSKTGILTAGYKINTFDFSVHIVPSKYGPAALTTVTSGISIGPVYVGPTVGVQALHEPVKQQYHINALYGGAAIIEAGKMGMRLMATNKRWAVSVILFFTEF